MSNLNLYRVTTNNSGTPTSIKLSLTDIIETPRKVEPGIALHNTYYVEARDELDAYNIYLNWLTERPTDA